MASKSAIAIAELRAQAVAKEMERKNNLMRLKWFEENYEKVYLNPSLPKDKVPNKAATLYEELIKMRKERFKEGKKLKLTGVEKTDCILDEDKEAILDIMYPVPSAIRNVLYEGVSHDEEGRYKYLKLRNEADPHKKFRQKVTSGFEYGWRIKENSKSPTKDYCRRNSWSWRVNGALNIDDPLRRSPYPAGHITFPSL